MTRSQQIGDRQPPFGALTMFQIHYTIFSDRGVNLRGTFYLFIFRGMGKL